MEVFSTLEILESFYMDQLTERIIAHDKGDVAIRYFIEEFKRKGQLLTLIDLKAQPEPFY